MNDPTITRLRDALDQLVDGLPAEPRRDVMPSVPEPPPRRRRVLAAGAAVVACALAAAGIVGVLGDDDPPTAVQTGEGGRAVATYELRLDGAEHVRDETLGATTADTALWGHGADTFLSLTVRPGIGVDQQAPSGLGPMTEDPSFPAAAGRAWIGGPDEDSLRMWLMRPNDDLWLLSAHWFGDGSPDRDELRRWALAIEPGPDGGYVLNDPELEPLAAEEAGQVASRARVWRYRGEEIVLLVIEHTVASGRSNLMALGEPQHVRVAGADASLVRDRSTGRTFVGWGVGGLGAAWASLTIPPGLAGSTDAILDALEPE